MAGLNSQITALLALGADAMDNLFDVNITLPPFLGAQDPTNKAEFRLRAGGFDPPKFTQSTYEVRYKSVGIKRPSSQITGDRQFQITFRLDAYYNVYTQLLKWRGKSFVPETGYATNSLPLEGAAEADDYYGTISVSALAKPIAQGDAAGWKDLQGVAENQIALGNFNDAIKGDDIIYWLFQNVWISDITEPKFKNGGGAIQEVTATFQFGEFVTPLTQKVFRDYGEIANAE